VEEQQPGRVDGPVSEHMDELVDTPLDPAPDTTRVRLDIAYDGTGFFGWGTQPALRTVQGTIEDALGVLFTKHGGAPRLTVAGRTDAGVHATGQVAHLDLTDAQLAALNVRRGRSGAPSLAYRLNGIAGLSSDVVMLDSRVAPTGFNARFSATWRRYSYRVEDMTIARNPLVRNHTLSYPAVLDLDAMNAAATSLLGLHDFATYCRPRERATTIRTLEKFEWTRDAAGVLVAEVRADAFCHSMVRSIVGLCLNVGEGKLSVSDAVLLLDARERTSAFKVAPARGLTLVEIGYPPDDELATRAELTRSRRDTLR